MDKKIIPIVFIADEDYIRPTCAAIQSLITNKKAETKYEVFIVTSKLSDACCNMLSKFNSENVIISVITASMEKINEINAKGCSYCQATKTALLKFELPNLLNNDLVIYMDGDIIVRKDLTDLYRLANRKKSVSAVIDSGKLYSGRRVVAENDTYFNSGVMVLNLKKMRRDNSSQKLFEAKKKSTNNSLMDQDIFNEVFRNDIYNLPIEYNFLYINLLRAESKHMVSINDLNSLFNTSYKSLDDIRKNSCVIHFASKNKPWKDPNVRLAQEWLSYFASSPAYDPLWLASQQVKWLMKENEALSASIAGLQRRISKLETDNKTLIESRNEIFKSKSFKIGFYITKIPRKIREIINRIKEKSAHKKKFRYLRSLPLVGLNTEERDIKIICSLTTYSKRIGTVDIVISSLLRQTFPPDKIILTLTESDYKINMTKQLKRMMADGLIEIITCSNDFQSPHKKYYYVMQKYPDDIVITVDDDVEYRSDLIEKLYASYVKFPTAVSAMRTHRIRIGKNNDILPYSNWRLRESRYILEPRHDLFATGCGGVLYPPHALYKDLFDINKIRETCFMADDIWLKFMELLNGVPVVLADKQEKLIYIDETQESGLFNNNVYENGNDLQFSKLMNMYDEYNIPLIIQSKI